LMSQYSEKVNFFAGGRCRVIVLLAVCFLCQGCRSLRSVRQTRELSAARQRSLRGTDELQQQNYDQAETLFAEALRRSPADERAQWGMAEVLWQRSECGAAIEHMEQAAKISGENPELRVRLGEMYLKEDELQAAMDNAERAIGSDRQNAGAWALRGQVLRRQHDLNEAMHSYHRSLIYQPNNPLAQIELAEIYRELKRPQRALATLDGMLDTRTDDQFPARAWMLKGLALADLGQRKDAQDCLKQAAICAADSDAALLLELAQVQFEAGELAEARICLGRALRHDPQNPQALSIQVAIDRRFREFSNGDGLQVLPVGFGPEPTTSK
jgi:Tfp pilus assembly protein PilF